MATDHPNAALARRLWTATADSDVETIRALLAPDIVWRASGDNLLSGEYRGPDEVLHFLALAGETADELRLRLDSVFFNDDGAVLAYHVSARRGHSRLDADQLLLLLIRDGRVSEALSVSVDQLESDRFWS